MTDAEESRSSSRPPAAVSRRSRARSASESLLSIVLGLEAILVFFVMLTAFGMKALPPAAAFGGGIGLIVALVLVAGVVRYRWGVWLGWALQVVLVATGILLPAMWVIGLGFAAIWIYCFIKGRQLDRAKAEYLSSLPNEES